MVPRALSSISQRSNLVTLRYSLGLLRQIGSVGFQVWTSFSKSNFFPAAAGTQPEASAISAILASSRFRKSGFANVSTSAEGANSPLPSQSGHFTFACCPAISEPPG
jgi:hypothetical protein